MVGIALFSPLLTSVVEANSLTDSIKNANTDLTGVVDDAGVSIVDLFRGAGIVITIVLVVWIGFTMFFSGNAQSLMNMKYRVGALVLALVLTFKTEAIVGWLFGILGYTI